MNKTWQDFLTDCGAVLDEQGVRHFGNPEQETRILGSGHVFADLSHFGIIEARGADARQFIQGQFTNDARQITPEAAQITGYCNPKGRLLAIFRIIERMPDHFLLLTPRAIVADTLNRLRMFVLRSAVELRDASDDFAILGVSGEKTVAQLEQSTALAIPGQVNGVNSDARYCIIRLPDNGGPRCAVIAAPEDMKGIWGDLDVHGAPIGYAAWDYLDLEAGVPVVQAETRDTFIPQTVNLDLVGGISFKKGCYTGQEIVARLQYLGTVKRRMYRFDFAGGETAVPGTPVYDLNSATADAAGHVVASCAGPGGGIAALVCLQTAAAEGELRLGSKEGPQLTRGALPYDLTD
ncbi:MAG: folate-binding protein [Gammaproteobacteria bacterium]|nr:folate-binding protein [Gammaproteobacteria bacterium]